MGALMSLAAAVTPALPSSGAASSAVNSATSSGGGINLPNLISTMLVFIPIVVAAGLGLMPDRTRDQMSRIRTIALWSSAVVVAIVLMSVLGQITDPIAGGRINGGGSGPANPANPCSSTATFCELRTWFGNAAFPISSYYHFDGDGFTLPMLTLSSVMFFVTLLAQFRRDAGTKRTVLLLLVLETAVNGLLLAQDYLLVLAFWGLLILPTYLLLRQARGPVEQPMHSRLAAWFLGHMLTATAAFSLGALLLVVHAIPPLLRGATVVPGQAGKLAPTFDLAVSGQIQGGGFAGYVGISWLGFGLMAGATLVLLGAVPFHRWVVEAVAHTDSTIGAIVVVVVSRLGAAVLIREVFTGFVIARPTFGPDISIIGAVTAIWGAGCAVRQIGLRRQVAYIGVVQTGLILVAAGSLTAMSLVGVALMLLAGGFAQAMLLALTGWIEERTRVHTIASLGGLAHRAPRLAALWIVGVLSACGTPLLAGFPALYSTLLGSLSIHPVAVAGALLAVALITVVMLMTVQRVFFGPDRDTWQRVRDGSTVELAYLAGPVIFLVLYGVFIGPMFLVIYNGVSSFLTVGGS